MEAICIHLCTRHPHPRREAVGHARRRAYTSRWKLVLSDYNSLRSRLHNSHALLEGTNLVLFTINEATLVRWYKNTTRREEITTLMQGLRLPAPDPCSTVSLPPPRQQPSSPGPSPIDPLTFEEPEDTTGRASVRGASAFTAGIHI